MALKKARVLTGLVIGEMSFKANDVIEGEAATIKGLGDAVDDSPAAVKYALEIEGANPVRIDAGPPAEEAPPAE